MKGIIELFVDRFSIHAVDIFTPNIVREVYDNCDKLTNLMIKHPDSVLWCTLKDMAEILNIPDNIQLEKSRVDIALVGRFGEFIIPVEVENNSGHGPRDNTIFSSEIPKLLDSNGKLAVLITYDYNEHDRQMSKYKFNWRFDFIERLNEYLIDSKTKIPFLLIIGNTPKYAGSLHSYEDRDCVVNWSFWMKYPESNGTWV